MKLVISGQRIKLSKKQLEYIERKIGNLDKYIPGWHSGDTKAEVRIKKHKTKRGSQPECETAISLPHRTLIIKESGSTSVFSAIDKMENKLKIALKKYKDRYSKARAVRKMSLQTRR